MGYLIAFLLGMAAYWCIGFCIGFRKGLDAAYRDYLRSKESIASR